MKAVAYTLFFILFITANSAANSDAKLKQIIQRFGLQSVEAPKGCLLYTSDAADE